MSSLVLENSTVKSDFKNVQDNGMVGAETVKSDLVISLHENILGTMQGGDEQTPDMVSSQSPCRPTMAASAISTVPC